MKLEPCTFCQIITGTLPASIVHDDAATLAFMDLRQPNAHIGGHVLVVPQAHIEQIYDLDAGTAARLMETAVQIARGVRELGAEGLSIWQSNGEAGGQEVPHVHLHVLARAAGDGLLQVYDGEPPAADEAARERLAARIRLLL